MGIKILHIAAVAVAAITLTACGGGGSSESSAVQVTPVPVAPVPARTDFALQAASPSTYTSITQQFYAQVNAARLEAGAGALAQDVQLDAAATAHLNYLRLNFPTNSHSEISGQPGFTGETVAARAAAAAYSSLDNRTVAEVMSFSTVNGDHCVDDLLATVYHLQVLLGDYRDIGIAAGEIAKGTYGCVLNLGVKATAHAQLPDVGIVTMYPAKNQGTVNRAFTPAAENPNPMPDSTGEAGQPVMVSMRSFGFDSAAVNTVGRFELRDSSGALVPARIIAAAGTNGAGVTADPHPGSAAAGVVYLVPLSPLIAAMTYNVEFSGSNGAQTYNAAWSFTTR